MLSFLGYSNGKIVTQLPSDLAVFLSQKNNVAWLDFEKPTENEYAFLQKNFTFHPLTIADCKASNKYPKVDEFPTYLFVVLHRIHFSNTTRTADKSSDKFHLDELDVMLSPSYLITVHNDPSSTIQEVRKRLLARTDLFDRGPDFIFYELLAMNTEKYFPLLEHWDERIDALENSILKGKTQNALSEIFHLKKKIASLRRALAPQRELLNRFARRDFAVISEHETIYFRDVYDEMVRIHNALDAQRDLVSGIFEAYLSMISNRLNEIIQKLTIITVIFLPISFLAGLYGMNFRSLPFSETNFGFYAMAALMACVVFVTLIYFKKKAWL